jgi:predicted metal-dependent hydrolase
VAEHGDLGQLMSVINGVVNEYNTECDIQQDLTIKRLLVRLKDEEADVPQPCTVERMIDALRETANWLEKRYR